MLEFFVSVFGFLVNLNPYMQVILSVWFICIFSALFLFND